MKTGAKSKLPSGGLPLYLVSIPISEENPNGTRLVAFGGNKKSIDELLRNGPLEIKEAILRLKRDNPEFRSQFGK